MLHREYEKFKSDLLDIYMNEVNDIINNNNSEVFGFPPSYIHSSSSGDNKNIKKVIKGKKPNFNILNNILNSYLNLIQSL